jgi:hypothetical protein
MEPSTRNLTSVMYPTDHGTKYVTIHNEAHEFKIAPSYEELAQELDFNDPELVVDFLSDELKVLIKVDDAFYHFFIDSLPQILKIHRESPERLIVIYLQTARPSKTTDSTIQLLLMILNGEGVNYRAVTIDRGENYYPVFKINNFSSGDPYFSEQPITTFEDVLYAKDLVIAYARKALGLTDESKPPYKKVYLTRGPEAGTNVGTPPEDYNAGYKDDIRMNDAWKLEEFFASMGYEIVNPEIDFESLLHQIVFMTDIKTLVSVTSSGLASMIFMQPRQTVIELQAEIVQMSRRSHEDPVIPIQGVHTMYATLSFMKEHLLVSVPSRRDPDRVIEALTEGPLSYLI